MPRKVLQVLPYGGEITVLGQVVRRLRRCKRLNGIVIATTTDEEDAEIADVAKKEDAEYFRGSRDDVLGRFYGIAKENKASVIVRVTSDCPCIDPQIVDEVIDTHVSSEADYTSNTLARTFPHGLDTAVLSFRALEKAHLEAKQSFEREHVCPYIYKSNPQMFKISSVEAPARLRAPDIRITLDTEQDYALLCAVFDYLYPQSEHFGTEEIIKLFRDKPWLKTINKNVFQKKIFDSPKQEFQEAVRLLDLQELKRTKEILMTHLK